MHHFWMNCRDCRPRTCLLWCNRSTLFSTWFHDWFYFLQCLPSCGYHKKIRQQFALEENPCHDCLVHFCALCQEYHELQSPRFDMSLGWQGNVERQNRGVAMEATTSTVERWNEKIELMSSCE
ncbi:hypothetical protein Patl1_15495 [Pistacia atlantica]|uniref:Uncharacterized protein n=1 Tax=Pistacia atlantica TaxID=434234 RepID=A0ACC1B7U1_9ROSI|nr:hypothetical protein Patl1_15495 [Pistacia atlantica]